MNELTGITLHPAYGGWVIGAQFKRRHKIHLVGKIPKRATIEPVIGHLKSDYQLNRNDLKSKVGDHANVVLVAAVYYRAKLLA